MRRLWSAPSSALIALRLVPYMIGYAGAYDSWQWLTFAPFDLSLAFGPLVWVYVTLLSTGGLPVHWRLHAIPAALQLGYQLAAFGLPLQTKWDWYTTGHRHVVEPVGFALVDSRTAYLRRRFCRHNPEELVVLAWWIDSGASPATAFRVHVEVAATHITMNPVAVNIQCHSARRANAVITPGGIDFK